VHFPNSNEEGVGETSAPGLQQQRHQRVPERVAFLKLAGLTWIRPKRPQDQAKADFTAEGPSSKWFQKCKGANGTEVKSHIHWVGEFRHVFAEMFAMHVDRTFGLYVTVTDLFEIVLLFH
jgi:hypothetical protein